jgi:hypothetical protein
MITNNYHTRISHCRRRPIACAEKPKEMRFACELITQAVEFWCSFDGSESLNADDAVSLLVMFFR